MTTIGKSSNIKTDGRVERTAATRRSILAAARMLILDGRMDPTAREIADRTGVTTRTLFRHFVDMDALQRSLIEDADANAALVMDEPFPDPASQTWRELLDVVIERRVRVYESLLPLYISTIWSRDRAEISGARQRRSILRRRKRLKEILPEEIAADRVYFEALDGVLSIEFWISLRRDQGLSVARSTEVLRLVVAKLNA